MIAFLHKLGGASAIKSKLSIAFGLHKFSKIGRKITPFHRNRQISDGLFYSSFSYILRIYFFKLRSGISIMRSPNAFDFSAFIKFSLVSPSEATHYLPSFCPTTQSVSMNAEKFACFFYGISSKIRYFRLFAYHNNLSPFDLFVLSDDFVINFCAAKVERQTAAYLRS